MSEKCVVKNLLIFRKSQRFWLKKLVVDRYILLPKKWSNESLNDGNKWWKTKHGISNLDCCRNRLRPGSSYLGQMHPEISEQNSYLKLQYAWRPIFDLSVPGKLTLCILKSRDFLQKILGRVSFTVSDACMKRCSWPLPNLFNCF